MYATYACTFVRFIEFNQNVLPNKNAPTQPQIFFNIIANLQLFFS